MSKVYDLFEGRKERDKGMLDAALNQGEKLALAREIAVELGRRQTFLSIDDVNRTLLDRHGIQTLGMAAGSVFKIPCFRATDRFKPTRKITSHARPVRIWEYIG